MEVLFISIFFMLFIRYLLHTNYESEGALKMADRLCLQGGGDKEHSTGGRDKNKQITSIVKCLEEKIAEWGDGK